MQACRSLDARKIRLSRRQLAIGRIFVLHGDVSRCITALLQADDNVCHQFGGALLCVSLILSC